MPDEVIQRPREQRPLEGLFAFLQTHHHWSRDLQRRESLQALAPFPGPENRAKRLFSVLHEIANTQSRPQMGDLGPFWRQLHGFISQDPAPTTRRAFTEHLEHLDNVNPQGNGPWERLFNALRAQDGWGDKTSALFVKTAIRIHSDETLTALHFWDDTGNGAIDPQDRLHVPVDKVIRVIFNELWGGNEPDFKKINSFLAPHYGPGEMLIWDDLWFWGFFTQTVQKDGRVLGWNSDKFWCNRSSPFANEDEVRTRSAEFLRILENLRNPPSRSVADQHAAGGNRAPREPSALVA